MAGGESGSRNDQRAKAEFMLRQTRAQIAAAQATEETARYTREYTRYMFWSVVVLALSALGNFILEIIKL
jgi:Na+-driven multidrug efflux pump